MRLKPLAKAFGKAVTKNAPTILIAAGIGGMATAVIFAIKEKDKAVENLEEAECKKIDETSDPNASLTLWEKTKAIAPAYWPTALIFTTSAGMILFANHLSVRRQAALLTAAELSESALRRWQKHTMETVDEETGRKIKDKVYQEQASGHSDSEEIYDTGGGNLVCMDSITGKQFKSSQVEIDKAVNYLNALLLEEGEGCLNDFFDYLNLSHSEIGYKLGWKYSDHHDLVSAASHYIKLPNGDPCLVVEYNPRPDYDFRCMGY